LFGRTATTATTAAATTGASIGNVDANPTAVEFRVVHFFNGIFGLRLIAISYETESTRAIRLAITHHDRLFKV
jgi:hypothetical protein